jgi:hypothetical protein
MAERAEAGEELIYLSLRDVDPVALDGAQYRALQVGESRSAYLRKFLKETFYKDGLYYRQMLRERSNV